MKIGILTFHSSYNYGAIVQAWALQTHLLRCGHDVSIINYEPVRSSLPWWTVPLRKCDFKRLVRDWQFRSFRRSYLHETKNVSSVAGIATLGLDAVIVGSDQVWNVQYFTRPDGRYNDVYLLHGHLGTTTRLAYAASIGNGEWERYRWKDELLDDIRAFDAISVREAVAREELKTFGIEASLVPDPVLLLDQTDYNRLTHSSKMGKHYIFSYLLSEYTHVRPMVEIVSVATRKNAYLVVLSSIHDTKVDIISPKKWLSALANADFVITDSFHGTALSIIFNVPFVTILKSDKPTMNARVTELLEAVGLSSRIVGSVSEILTRINDAIEWDVVNKHLAALRETGRMWLMRELK